MDNSNGKSLELKQSQPKQTPENGTCTEMKSVKDSVFEVLLKLLIFIPIKHYKRSLWISLPHCAWMFINCVKLRFFTKLAFTVGACRSKLSSDINHGHLTLRHALLQGWDASFETPPFTAAIGKFALYSIEDFNTRINFSVEQFYNIQTNITGAFQRLGHDKLSLEFNYFQKGVNYEIVAESILFDPGPGLTNKMENGVIKYSYNVTEDLKKLNLEDIFHRVLLVRIRSSLHSVRVSFDENRITCFAIAIDLSFKDNDHNGQVNIDMQTDTRPVSCSKMNFTVAENEPICPKLDNKLLSACKGLTFVTAFFDGISILFSIGLICLPCWTKRHHYDLTKLPHVFRFWNVFSCVGDVLILYGAFHLSAMKDHTEKVALPAYDNLAFHIGLGCLLGWISILRFLKINNKFSLLFHTLYYSFWNVFAFLVCAAVLFVGFFTCAYVSLGVYHEKFATQELSAETLFSLINGDDVFNTFANLNDKLAGDPGTVKLYRNIIVYSFVILFSIIMLNLIIALFNSAYENVMKKPKKESKNATKRPLFDYLYDDAPIDTSTSCLSRVCCSGWLAKLFLGGENRRLKCYGNVFLQIWIDRPRQDNTINGE